MMKICLEASVFFCNPHSLYRRYHYGFTCFYDILLLIHLTEFPITFEKMSNQARWSLLQSYNLLKWHRHAHRAAVKAMQNGGSLSVIIRKIEEVMSSSR